MSRTHRAAPALPLVLLLTSLSGCEPAPEPIPPEVARVRDQSARGACVAAELLRRGSDDVASLEETLASTSDSSAAAQVTRRAGMAALSFARVYEQHARLRMERYAQLDSAYNHSPRQADSLAHIQAAEQLSIRVPDPGTVEANAVAAYDRDFTSLFGDPDHPCNWDLEEEEDA